MTLTLYGWASHLILLTLSVHIAVRTPKVLLLLVWPLPRSLATTSGISVDFFSSPYLDVSVQAVPYVYLCVQYTLTDLHLPGCPIRISPDIAPAYGSPRLFAVNHVLLRLPVPRHSPCALCSLTFLSSPRLFQSRLLCDPLKRFFWVISLVENVILLPFSISKILWLFKTVVTVSYLSFVFHYFVQFSRCDSSEFLEFRFQYLNCCLNTEIYLQKIGGLKWTRTIDLPLIRRTL